MKSYKYDFNIENKFIKFIINIKMKEIEQDNEEKIEENYENKPKITKKTSLDKELNLDTDIESIANEILNQYQKGINSIIETPSPKDNEIYILFILNCPSSFSLKYDEPNKQTSSLLHNIIAAKYVQQQTSNYNKIFNPSSNFDFSNTTNKDIETITDEVKKRINEMKRNINLLHQIFELFEKSTKELIDLIIFKYLKKKKEEIIKKNNEFYEMANKIYKEIEKKGEYSELNFDDFLLIFCSIIKYYSGLNIHLDFSESKEQVFLEFYGNEGMYDNLCEFFDYELQMRPLALQYDIYKNTHHSKNTNIKFSYNSISNNPIFNEYDKENENNPLLEQLLINEKNIPQFKDYDINNAIYWPPYYHFKVNKKNKFRRYTKGDEYHECDKNLCNFDEKTQNCLDSSKYRGIDKLRLIYSILDYLLKFSSMYKEELLFMMLYKKNYSDYKKIFSDNKLVIDSINPFNYKSCDNSINSIRNYFGENVSFFFLWFDNYTRWLIFPSIVGILLLIMYYTNNKVPILSIFSSKIKMDYYDFCLIVYCIIISFWLILFQKIWNQKEKLYCHIWGMNEIERKSIPNEEFIPNAKEEIIFGYFVPIESQTLHLFKKYVSNSVLIFMIFVVLFIIYYLFRLKAHLVNGDINHDFKIGIFIASINGFQIKIMNLIYYYIAIYLNNWENHSKMSTKNNSLAQKLIFFDFVNSYSALFYIAFIKPYKEGCINNNCLKEIEMQIYTIFLIYLGLFIFEIVYHWLFFIYKKRKLEYLLNNKELEFHSLEHQMLCYPIKSMNFEYNNIINQFGYLCLFSVAAPLTPLFVFILALIGRVVGYHKLINYERVEILEGVKGIGLYKKMLNTMFFIGMLVNVAIVLFSSPHFAEKTLSRHQIEFKMLIFALVENCFLIFVKFVDWNIYPKWFKYTKIIKELYLSKFFYKGEALSKLKFDSEDKAIR